MNHQGHEAHPDRNVPSRSSRSICAALLGFAAGSIVDAAPAPPAPTHADVPYGSHPKQILDFYQAPSDRPAPVAFLIHGGGWSALSKDGAPRFLDIPRLHAAGISVVSIEYRFIQDAQAAKVHPPVKWPLEDAARALQFVRSKAQAWNLDKQRIGGCGGSAGACSALWLALHDDMADPASADPVARESTRLSCAALAGAQTTLDPQEMREWMPNAHYGGHAFGFRDRKGQSKAEEFQRFHAAREKLLPLIREYSPITHASPDDPPLWLSYQQKEPAVKGEDPKDPTHSASFGLLLREKLRPLGVEMILTYPAAREGRLFNATEYFLGRWAKDR